MVAAAAAASWYPGTELRADLFLRDYNTLHTVVKQMNGIPNKTYDILIFKPMVTGKHRNICNLHITFNLPASHTHVKNRRTPLHDWKILKVYLRGTHITGGKVRKGQNRASLLWTPPSCRDYRQRYNPISSAFPTVPSHESLSPAAR